MTTKLLPFSIKYKDKDGKEREGVVFAYDEKTARSRACHEAMVDELDDILSVTEISPEDAGKIVDWRLKPNK